MTEQLQQNYGNRVHNELLVQHPVKVFEVLRKAEKDLIMSELRDQKIKKKKNSLGASGNPENNNGTRSSNTEDSLYNSKKCDIGG